MIIHECLEILRKIDLLKLDAYSKNFKKTFLAKNPCDCYHIKSSRIAGSVNDLNYFHFSQTKKFSGRPMISWLAGLI